jgi:hypothetical protein
MNVLRGAVRIYGDFPTPENKDVLDNAAVGINNQSLTPLKMGFRAMTNQAVIARNPTSDSQFQDPHSREEGIKSRFGESLLPKIRRFPQIYG